LRIIKHRVLCILFWEQLLTFFGLYALGLTFWFIYQVCWLFICGSLAFDVHCNAVLCMLVSTNDSWGTL
jgi:hypothetical protein